MVSVMELWLPILVSAGVVFVVSALAWMVMPHHKADIKVLPADKSGLPEMTKGMEAGVYMWPNCSTGEEMKSEAFKQAYKEGPWGVLTVMPSQPSMGRNMGLGMVSYLLISVFVAYLAGEARGPGAEFVEVFQVAGAAAVGIYALGWMPGAIWFGKPARAWVTDLIDCLVYGLITGATFALLWPSAEGAQEMLNNLTG